MDVATLARKHLDRQLAALRQPGLSQRPPRGWVRAIRDALGMTTTQLAERMGISQPRVTDIEKREMQDALTLATLRKAAEALDCTLVYALVPNRPLEDTVRERAKAIAEARLARVHHTMALEDQAVPLSYLTKERDRLVTQILQEGPRRLWDPM
jgi:predicted DNA-binding mobile mystery protein A